MQSIAGKLYYASPPFAQRAARYFVASERLFRKYHDARKIADDILQLLSGNTENLVSYEPTVQL